MSFYWKTRTLLSGDYREIERNLIEYKNAKVIKKYKGKKDIYCVIRLHSDEGGLFCLWFKALQGIHYSLKNGFIPVIDMQTKENILTTKKQRKTINIWEKFFEQPIKDVHFQSVKNLPNKVVIENPTYSFDYEKLVNNPTIRNYWRTMVSKYIRFSDEARANIKKYEDVFENKKVLGVLARGTDYLNPSLGHLTKLNNEEILRNIENKLDECQCEKFFLATEDSNILNAVKDYFRDKVIFVEQKRYDGTQAKKLGQMEDYVRDAVDMNLAYLTAMYYLSRCDYFWGSATTGSKGVYLMKNCDFKSFEFWKEPLDLEEYDINRL